MAREVKKTVEPDADDFLAASLVDWRWQCEERIRRWAESRATPEWSLDVHETLQLLDALDAKDNTIAALTRERDDAIACVKKFNKALKELGVVQLARAAQRVCTTPLGDWVVSVDGEAFNSLDAVLRQREESL